MALIVETGAGLADAEGYCSTSDADAYHTKFGNEAWSYLDTDAKEILIRRATRDLDILYSFVGKKSSTTQSLQWPRTGDYVGIPTALIHATSELALISNTNDVTGLADLSGNVSELTEKLDVIGSTVKYFAPTNPQANLLRKVSLLLQDITDGSATGMYATVVRG